VAEFGRVEELAAGTVLFEVDDRGVDFFLVLQGFIEIYETPEGDDGAPQVMTVHAMHQFTGELDLFTDRAILVGGRMGADGRVARLSRGQFRRMLAAEPDVAEIVMRAFILRRAAFISHGHAAVTLVGSRRSADTLRLQRFLTRNGHPVHTLEPGTDPEADARLDAAGLDADHTPVAFCGPRHTLVRPSIAELAHCLGISEQLDPTQVIDVAVVGAGPSGLAAAVYAASEGCARSCWRARPPAGRRARARASRTTSVFPPGCPARRWPSGPRCRRRSSAPGSPCPARPSRCVLGRGRTRSSSTTGRRCAPGRWCWPRVPATGGWTSSTGSTASRGAASTTRPPRWRRGWSRARRRWWSAAATPPGRPRSSSPAPRPTSTSSSAANPWRRACPSPW